MYDCAKDLQPCSWNKRRSWKHNGYLEYLSDQVDKVVQLLYKLKSVGEVVTNVDLVRIEMPWAGSRAKQVVCLGPGGTFPYVENGDNDMDRSVRQPPARDTRDWDRASSMFRQ